MPKSNFHIIQKANLEIDFRGLEDALGIQDAMSLLFHEKLTPILDQAFSKFDKTETYQMIESLDLDLGQIHLENWEEEVCRKLEKMLQENLSGLLVEKAETNSQPTNAASILFYFLKSGRFPWNCSYEDLSDLEEDLKVDRNFLDRLIDIFQAHPLAKSRFVANISEKFQFEILLEYFRIYVSKHADFFRKTLARFISIKKQFPGQLLHSTLSSHDPKEGSLKFWEWLTDEVQNWENTELGKWVLEYLKQDTKLFEEMLESIQSSEQASSQYQVWLELIEKSQKTGKADFNELHEILREKLNDPVSHLKKTSQHTKAIKTEDTEKSLDIFDPKDDEPIYIENAGMVLAHPFLTQLFEHLQLWQKDEGLSKKNLHQAMELLEYMVWGENDHREPAFPLNKILCGRQPDDLYLPSEGLPEMFKKETDELLLYLIRYWEKLKNTGIDGLREAFLQRPGKLLRRMDGWKLQVEQRGVDVLLGSLPWTYGIIKLPWMQEMLYVEWG